MKISRREFLKYSLYGASSILLPVDKVFSKIKKESSEFPDLVGVKGGSPHQMFQAGINALGGMKRFVKKGQVVLVKPNAAWDKTPSEGANTNPDLVGEIVKEAYRAGASKVVVFDHACNLMENAYKNSGIEKAVKDNLGFMLPSDIVNYYVTQKLDTNKKLQEVRIHQSYMNSDVIINVPILKHHASATMTAAIKNLMGVVWDRSYWHRNDLHTCIAEFPLFKKPHLNIIDAYQVMIKNGPRGVSPEDLVIKKMQILSTDIVLADTAAAAILDTKIENIRYLEMAEKLGLGSTKISSKNIKRISLS